MSTAPGTSSMPDLTSGDNFLLIVPILRLSVEWFSVTESVSAAMLTQSVRLFTTLAHNVADTGWLPHTLNRGASFYRYATLALWFGQLTITQGWMSMLPLL